MALMPKVIMKTVTREIAIIHEGTRSKRLLKKTSNSPSRSNGTKFSQNLLHNRERSEMGDVCKIQKAFPSRLTAGKAKRMATALRTKPDKAKLTKETTVFNVAVGIGERSSGRTLKLYRYTTTRATSKNSWDHWVVSRKKVLTSLRMIACKTVGNGRVIHSSVPSSQFKLRRPCRDSCALDHPERQTA